MYCNCFWLFYMWQKRWQNSTFFCVSWFTSSMLILLRGCIQWWYHDFTEYISILILLRGCILCLSFSCIIMISILIPLRGCISKIIQKSYPTFVWFSHFSYSTSVFYYKNICFAIWNYRYFPLKPHFVQYPDDSKIIRFQKYHAVLLIEPETKQICQPRTATRWNPHITHLPCKKIQ